jgi:hypothetical protein
MDDPIRKYCLEKGYARHVVDGGLDYLLKSWEKAATHVAEGYCFGLDDFRNDMDGRQILSEVLSVATDEQKQSIESRLKAADELFIASTVESSGCVWGKSNEEQLGYSREKDWYYYRVPKGLPDWSAAEW